MWQLRCLLTLCLTTSLLAACSDSGSNSSSSPTVNTAEEGSKTPATSDSDKAEETSNTPDDTQEPIPTPIKVAPVINEKFVDHYITLIIDGIRDQVAADPQLHDKEISNIQLANRIFKVDFKPGKNPSLTLVTHSAKGSDFVLTKTAGDTQYFVAYKRSELFFSTPKKQDQLYSAEVKTIPSKTNKKNVYIIKIVDTDTNAAVHVLYVKKQGKTILSYDPNHDYTKEVSKTSRLFIQRTLENPLAVGEFYRVITEKENNSNATRFNITISDNFVMTSQPITDYYRDLQTRTLPLMIDYKGFWHSIFKGSAAYRVIRNASYKIELSRNPVELTALNLDLNIESAEDNSTSNKTLPLGFFINFNK